VSCRNSALARGKTFIIASMSETVREALQISGLQQIFENPEKD
jgi:anti-anti-sigma regulatory factor